jgi:phospholipid transport system substrate-binding protein
MKAFKHLLRSFLLFAALVLQAHAFAQEAPAALIERISREVLDTARADPQIQRGDQERILELVRQRILPHVDFERMTALAAGRFWRRADEAQQQRLTEEFRDLLVHVYSGAIAQAGDKKLVMKPMRGNPASGDVVVQTEVIQGRGADPVELSYRLAKEEGGWKIYDMSVLGVWLVQSYRNTFANEISQSGIDGLISRLEEKNRRLSTSGK